MHEAQMRAALHHVIRRHRRIVSAGKQARHPPRGVRRQAARAGNFPRVHQRHALGDFHVAGHLRLVQSHAHAAACRAQFFQQVTPDVTSVSMARRAEIVLSLRFARTAKRSKSQRLHFLPRRAAQRVHVSLDRPRHRVKRNSHHALHSRRSPPRATLRRPAAPRMRSPGCSIRSTGIPCSAMRSAVKQLAQEKSPVAALQPQLVIVDDDDRIAHAKFHAALMQVQSFRKV